MKTKTERIKLIDLATYLKKHNLIISGPLWWEVDPERKDTEIPHTNTKKGPPNHEN
jgi:hypothetical protein